MYVEGMADLDEMIMLLPLCPPDQKDAKIALIKERTTNRYLPAFEKVSGLFNSTLIKGRTINHCQPASEKVKGCWKSK